MSWKVFQWWPSFSMRTDRRKVMTKLTFNFRNFAKASERDLGCFCHGEFSCSVNIYQHLLLMFVWYQLRGCLWVIYVRSCFIVGQPFRTFDSRNVYRKLQLIFLSNTALRFEGALLRYGAFLCYKRQFRDDFYVIILSSFEKIKNSKA
jgi:hypothetical protein